MSYTGLGQQNTSDRTARDWAAGIRAGGEILSSIVGAASGGGASATTPSTAYPSTAYPGTDPYASAYPYSTTTTESSWTIPLLVGGVAIVGIGAYFLMSRRSVKANRRSRRRR